MLLSDIEIKELCKTETPMIEPYWDRQMKKYENQKVISFGQSSYGYDIRLDNKFKVFTNINSSIIDPKNFTNEIFTDFKGDSILIPPNSFVLCASMEYFRMPRDVTAICIGKSTYARTGLIVNVTPLEPGWEGILTIELSNSTPLPLKVYAKEGIAQLLFFRGNPCSVTYKDRDGKYQEQTDITLPKV